MPLFNTQSGRPAPRRTFGPKLGLEVLEDRTALSAASLSVLPQADYAVAQAAAVVAPARIVTSQSYGPSAITMSSIRVTFDRVMQLSSFTPADCVLTGPTGAIIPVKSIKDVAPSGGKGFDITFALQSTPGTYTLKVGPNVKDAAGLNMALYTGTFTVPRVAASVPKVISSAAIGPNGTSMNGIRVTFDRAIQVSTFTAADVVLTRPGGATVPVTSVVQVAGSGGKTFTINFGLQSTPGTYTVKVGPNVKDLAGNNMTLFTGNYTLSAASAPRIVSSATAGPSPNTINSIKVTFDRAMQPSTFTAADVVLIRPGGAIVPVSSVVAVAGSSGKTFIINFATQSTQGTYTLKVGPNVKDVAGLNMSPFTGTYQISAQRTYTSSTPAAITPQGRAVTLISVPDTLTIGDINVVVNITHPKLSDLHIHLQAPDGTDVVLSSRLGGSSSNMVGTVFDDEAGIHAALGRGPYSGSYQPQAPLSILDGKQARGTWKLWVEDRGGINRGTLNSWSLVISPRAAQVV